MHAWHQKEHNEMTHPNNYNKKVITDDQTKSLTNTCMPWTGRFELTPCNNYTQKYKSEQHNWTYNTQQ